MTFEEEWNNLPQYEDEWDKDSFKEGWDRAKRGSLDKERVRQAIEKYHKDHPQSFDESDQKGILRELGLERMKQTHKNCGGTLDTSKSTGDWATCKKCEKKVYANEVGKMMHLVKKEYSLNVTFEISKIQEKVTQILKDIDEQGFLINSYSVYQKDSKLLITGWEEEL